MGTNSNKFVAYTSAVAVLGAANNLGFRGNCEIHEAIPACHLVGTEPLHTHDHHTPIFLSGTNTSTISSGHPHIITSIPGAMNFTGTTATVGSGDLQAWSSPLPNDEAAEFAMNQQDDQVDEGLLPGLYDSSPVQS